MVLFVSLVGLSLCGSSLNGYLQEPLNSKCWKGKDEHTNLCIFISFISFTVLLKLEKQEDNGLS